MKRAIYLFNKDICVYLILEHLAFHRLQANFGYITGTLKVGRPLMSHMTVETEVFSSHFSLLTVNTLKHCSEYSSSLH